jgi:hypothetical protein
MGNGPSLRNSLKENESLLPNYDIIAVNDFALADEYVIYKPQVYVLCDPDYWFKNESSDMLDVVDSTYLRIIEKTDWNMQLYMPYAARKVEKVTQYLARNSYVHVQYFNTTKIEGFKRFQYFMLNRQWGVFRIQNVTIAALLLSIYSGYRQIFLLGIETDWIKNLWVDSQNRLRFKDTHFYGENDRILPHTIGYIYIAMYYAFQSYQNVARYAEYKSVNVFNATPSSFVDAFERKKLQ